MTNSPALFARDMQEMFGEVFFNAVVEVSGRTVSGVMVIKKDEANKCRILFTTVAGPKLMDMYISQNDYKILYVIKKLKRRIILRQFQQDFALISGLYLFGDNKNCENDSCTVILPKKKSAHYSFDAQNRICKAEYRGKGKLLAEVVYIYNNNDEIESISLRHHNFNMKITLSVRKLFPDV
ncbi:MAG: hypothetical protein LBS43_04605 [Prevotellaceae bacterium]|jgi:hypothetical protein|nr:hypothetical protein [Prevotellaceae bacterium]